MKETGPLMGPTLTEAGQSEMMAGQKPRSILIGRETLLGECGKTLQENGHEIVAVVAPAGPAASWAKRAGVPLFARSKDLLDAGLGAVDYLFSITNLAVLPADVLALASRAAINFHDGPLPAYAGLNTPAWALLAGEREHGVTWHLMTDAVDCGDVVAREAIVIEEGETSLSLNTKCFEAGLNSFTALARDLDVSLMRRQPVGSAPLRFFGKDDRPAAAAMIDWAAPAQDIARHIAALDFGIYRNPLGVPKALAGDRLLLVQGATVLDSCSEAAPGTVLEGGEAPVVATGSNDLRLDRIADANGSPLAEPALVRGDNLTLLDTARQATLNALDSAAARYEGWWHRRLAGREPLLLPQFLPSEKTKGAHRTEDRQLPAGRPVNELLAAWTAYLGRIADRDTVEIGYSDPVYRSRLEDVGIWFADQLPLHVAVAFTSPLSEFADSLATEIGGMHKRVAISRDLIARMPELRSAGGFAYPVAVQIVDHLDQAAAATDTVLHVAFAAAGGACRIIFDPERIEQLSVEDLWNGFEALLTAAAVSPDAPLDGLSVMSEDDHHRVVRLWNAEAGEVASVPGIHHMIAQQAQSTPERTAVTSRGRSLTYAELDQQANRLARHLHGLGVGPDVLVGLNVERSVDLAVCVLAIHKAGGAYVPLDPAYPRDRLAHMITDSGMMVIVTQSSLVDDLPQTDALLLCIDELADTIGTLSSESFDGGAAPENLAYVIYTSGSTGLPKGVMVEHRNAINFFAGMDRKLEPEGVWLAVTSLSFDISVLEICWPLTRGYHVVIATEREVRGDVISRAATPAPDFSLFYFASGDSASTSEQYRLLLEGARFADANGFEAVWTPERHFHAFGGPYPNPSVISAALAVSTSRVKIRAGSVVSTLHHPARIAEEWAVVDNLSNGRVGIAFASGWQPDDFILNPANFADRAGALKRSMDDVRALWRGESRSFPGPLGNDVEVLTHPRPVQPELPVWITSAGNVETFEEAGRAGAFVLTHLLGQNIEEVAQKAAAYRRAWMEAGHAGQGHVTLMLHSFVGDDADTVRSIVREPLLNYLRTSTNLLKQYAWSFPTFKRAPGADTSDAPDLSVLSEDETEALLEHAFNRYFESSGLFGTPEDCLPLIRRLRDIGVNEIGCLVDFGIETDAVLASLPALNRLRQLSEAEAGEAEHTLPELMAEHGVTHLQCTPSLLNVLASDGAARPQLTALKRLMIGGEAFPPHLARDMLSLVDGTVMNMYGPTETTIWSTVHSLDARDEVPPLGRPLLNQQVYIVDRRMQPVRPGTPGELIIAGDSVVRGYLNRPELTEERFIADPFKSGARAYRTGDLVLHRQDGTLEFLGRLDHQVKVRGYRIELGEIEAALADHADVVETVVIAHRSAEAADARLIAYLVPRGENLPTDTLRSHLRASLPEFMVPSSFIQLEALPRTPNGKIDRKALPDPDSVVVALAPVQVQEDANDMEAQIQSVWCELLNLPRVGLRDNFFDLGGHSLLAVQLHRRLTAISEKPVSLTDIFRFPTVATLADHLSDASTQPEAAREGLDRAQSRRAALQRRGAARALARN